MARIRSIKPEFFFSESLKDVSRDARLFFIGLWTLADREGRLKWSPSKIKAQIFPYDDDVVLHRLAEELARVGCLTVYEVDRKAYAWIPEFMTHQRPHAKEADSSLPPCPHDGTACSVTWNMEDTERQSRGKEVASTGRVVADPGDFPSATAGREGKGTDKQEEERTPHPVPEWPKPPRHAEPVTHRGHLHGFCGWVCLPEFLFNEFVERCPGGIGVVDAWTKQVRREWKDREVVDGNLEFWRKRWSERPSSDAIAKRGAAALERQRAAIEASR
jgi:hypothetical protein